MSCGDLCASAFAEIPDIFMCTPVKDSQVFKNVIDNDNIFSCHTPRFLRISRAYKTAPWLAASEASYNRPS